MRALRYQGDGSFKIEDVPKPTPDGNDVLIKVEAAAITNGELEWPETTARERPIPGHDVAGVIEGVGDKVTGFTPGDAVFALTSFSRSGAAADYLLVCADDLAIKPACLSFPEAASIPLSALTAYEALFTHAEAQPGQKILVAGAGGGVGVMVVQVARAAGLLVTAVCSSDKVDMVKDLGAHEVFDYRTTPLGSLSHDYDVVVDCVGGSTLAQTLALLKGKGRLICIARPATADEKAQRPDVETTYFIVEPDGEELTRIAQCVEQGAIKPVLETVLPLENGSEAFEILERGHARGKIVLTIDGKGDGRADPANVGT